MCACLSTNRVSRGSAAFVPSNQQKRSSGRCAYAVSTTNAASNFALRKARFSSVRKLRRRDSCVPLLATRVARLQHVRQTQTIALEQSQQLPEPPRIGHAQVFLDVLAQRANVRRGHAGGRLHHELRGRVRGVADSRPSIWRNSSSTNASRCCPRSSDAPTRVAARMRRRRT